MASESRKVLRDFPARGCATTKGIAWKRKTLRDLHARGCGPRKTLRRKTPVLAALPRPALRHERNQRPSLRLAAGSLEKIVGRHRAPGRRHDAGHDIVDGCALALDIALDDLGVRDANGFSEPAQRDVVVLEIRFKLHDKAMSITDTSCQGEIVHHGNLHRVSVVHSGPMNRIKELREARGWTMQELADRVVPTTTAPTINKIEKEQRGLTEKWMRRLALALGCAPAELLVLDEAYPRYIQPADIQPTIDVPETTAAKRLKEARKAAAYRSAADFARVVADDVHEYTYRSYENGTRALTIEAAKVYAQKIGVSWQYLIFGEDVITDTAPSRPPAKLLAAGLTENIREWLALEPGRTAAGLSRAAGLNPTAVRDILKGRSRSPKHEIIVALARAMDMTVDTLTAKPGAGPPEIDQGIDYAGEEYAAIGMYDVRVSAGPGAITHDEQPIAWHLFRIEMLRTVTNADPSRLALLRVDGDSMWDTLHSGDHVLVDRSVTRIGRDGLYVIRAGLSDELQVKRVQVQPDARITIRSDNPAYENYADVDPDEVTVLGRVVWLGRQV